MKTFISRHLNQINKVYTKQGHSFLKTIKTLTVKSESKLICHYFMKCLMYIENIT